jgi:hypothetical protein
MVISHHLEAGRSLDTIPKPTGSLDEPYQFVGSALEHAINVPPRMRWTIRLVHGEAVSRSRMGFVRERHKLDHPTSLERKKSRRGGTP